MEDVLWPCDDCVPLPPGAERTLRLPYRRPTGLAAVWHPSSLWLALQVYHVGRWFIADEHTPRHGICQSEALCGVYELVVTPSRKESRAVFPEGGSEETGVGKRAKKEYPPLQNKRKRKAERKP
jgi:hypothetical protein